jgi:hypothetical protein
MAKGGQGRKLAIAAVFFVLAGLAIAWQMGVFKGSPAPAKQLEERAEQVREAAAQGKVPANQPKFETPPP